MTRKLLRYKFSEHIALRSQKEAKEVQELTLKCVQNWVPVRMPADVITEETGMKRGERARHVQENGDETGQKRGRNGGRTKK